MKAIYPCIAATILLASCGQEAAQPAYAETQAQAPTASKQAPKPKPYPLETCLVTGDDLDEMDERVSTVHNGQTFEFCCKPCLVKFRKNPETYVAKLAASEKR